MTLKKEKLLIGRSEKVSLTELGLKNIDAKIDTGAYGCAIHCHHIRTVERKKNKYLCFDLLDPNHPQYERKIIKVKDFKVKRVKNSFGESEVRFTIKSAVELFGEVYKVELSLTNRSEMKYPVLLGRTFLKNRFIVDVARTNLSDKNNKVLVIKDEPNRRKLKKKSN